MTPEARAAAIAKGRLKRAENKEKRIIAKASANLETLLDVADKSTQASRNQTATQNMESPLPVVAAKDEFDKKLDHFQYSLDPQAVALWEHDETVSPLHVPKELKDQYPNLEWHWVSERNLKNKGRGYNGWEIFYDAHNPEGVMRGPDMRLGVMPKEMAERYRRRVSETSTEQVKNLQSGQIAKMDRAIAELNQANIEAGLLGDGEQLIDTQGRRREFSGAGISVGRRPAIGKGGNYQRGFSREEVHEMQAKVIEDRKKSKTYAFMGK